MMNEYTETSIFYMDPKELKTTWVDGYTSKQDGQYTYKVTLTDVRVTTIAVEKQQVLHILSVCVCSLRYPECNAHAPYYIDIWPVRLHQFLYIIS